MFIRFDHTEGRRQDASVFFVHRQGEIEIGDDVKPLPSIVDQGPESLEDLRAFLVSDVNMRMSLKKGLDRMHFNLEIEKPTRKGERSEDQFSAGPTSSERFEARVSSKALR